MEDERRLWIRWKEQGDEAAREQIIVNSMKVVKYIAGRMAIHVPPTVDVDDLVGWGVLGLLDAVEKYDHNQNIKFTTYASIRVRGAIIDQIRSLDWAPRSLRAMARKIGSARDALRHEIGNEPSYADIAGRIGVSSEQVEEVLAQLQTAQILALDDYVSTNDDDTGTRKGDLTTDAATLSPTEALEQQEKIDLLVQAILELPEQQQKVLHLYYYEQLTLKEIGVVLEVSESRICQIHSAATKALRKVLRGGA